MQYGYGGPFVASTLEAVLASRERLPTNAYLVFEIDGAAILSPEVAAVLGGVADLTAVVLELTGLGAHVDHLELLAALEPLRRRGLLLAVRATGDGSVGLLPLIDLAPEFVNVDSELVSYIDQRPRHAATVAAIGGLAGELDAWLMADGVRRIEEIARLRQLRVPLARGSVIGADRELMSGLEPGVAELLRVGAEAAVDHLTVLAESVRGVRARPALITETTVVVDADQRPQEIVVPDARRRVDVHPALCVQRGDRLAEVALRATSRPREHQLAPVCLVGETGRLTGLIRVEVLLRALAHG